VPLEVLVASHEDAAAGVAELWLDGQLFASTYLDDERRIVIEIAPGPWRVELGRLHRAIERAEELIAAERPGHVSVE
jgi:hypothetical protein